MMPTSAAASGVETLVARIDATIREWGPLSIPTLSAKLGVAPLHIRDAIDVSDGSLVFEGEHVDRRESCALTAVEAHVANHGSTSLEALAMALGRSLQAVRLACRRSKKIALVRQSHETGATLFAVFNRQRSA